MFQIPTQFAPECQRMVPSFASNNRDDKHSSVCVLVFASLSGAFYPIYSPISLSRIQIKYANNPLGHHRGSCFPVINITIVRFSITTTTQNDVAKSFLFSHLYQLTYDKYH